MTTTLVALAIWGISGAVYTAFNKPPEEDRKFWIVFFLIGPLMWLVLSSVAVYLFFKYKKK